ncbi:lipoprotein [Mesoplasma seiffertii]|uniref:lipoprotein n=1 Tax=Mesoplasma seiffertii TaxID=28224 RepID=UPI00056522CC|nr:lipoprotein [Mesoplasma seiffertii]
MKKILTILGAITLTASTSLSVVACGNTKTPPIPPTDEAISEFKTELNNIWSTVYNQNSAKFVRKIEASGDKQNYQLFNYNYLNQQYGGEGNESFDLFKNNSAQAMFVKDLNILFSEEEFASLIQSNLATGKDSIKFRNIYMGSAQATLGDFKISEVDDFSLQRTEYTNVNTSTKELMYSINVTVTKDMYYKNTQGNTEVHQTNKIPLKLLIGKEGQVLTFIEKVVNELPKQMIKNGDTNFSSSKIKALIPDFKTYTNSFDLSLHPFINDVRYKNQLSQNIEKINNEELKYQISYGNTIADHSDIKVMSEMLQNNTETNHGFETKTLYDLQRNPLANSLILKKTETEALTEKQALPMINEIIGDVSEAIVTHEQALKSFLSLYSVDSNLKDFLVQTSYSFGYFRLQNIYIELDQTTKLELPTMVIPWTYENDANLVGKEEALGKSIYQALKIVNNNVLKANSELVTNESWHEGNSYSDLRANIFTISDEIGKNLKNSFKRTWEDIEAASNPLFEYWNVLFTKDMFNFDPTTGVNTFHLVGSENSANTNNLVTNNELYDFNLFSAKIEGISGHDKREGTLTPTDSFKATDQEGLASPSLFVRGGWPAEPARHTSVLTLNQYHKENMKLPYSVNYKFNLGWMNFDLFLPFDRGIWLENFNKNNSRTWDGKEYWELSNDKSLFADSRDPNKFDWNLANPYKQLASVSESKDSGVYGLKSIPLLFFKNKD